MDPDFLSGIKGTEPESGCGLWSLTRGPANSSRDKYKFQTSWMINFLLFSKFILELTVRSFKMTEGTNA